VINVGAATETEMKEKKARVEDALHATRAAVEEGVVPGGGVALLNAQKSLAAVVATGDELVGVDIIRRALEAALNIAFINAAKERVPNIPVLINMVSLRVRQLNNGERPLVKPTVGEEKIDIALREIADGKLGYEAAKVEAPDPMSF